MTHLGSVTLTVACSVTFLGMSTSLKVISVLQAFAVNVLISWVDFSILNSVEVVVCFDTEDSEDADVVVLCKHCSSAFVIMNCMN